MKYINLDRDKQMLFMVRSDTMDKQWQSCIQINPKYDGEKVVSEV